MSFVLGIEDISPDLRTDEKDKDLNDVPKINTNSPLFNNISNILRTLHLLYEDSKLNKFHWKGCPTLASFLSRYVYHHYSVIQGKIDQGLLVKNHPKLSKFLFQEFMGTFFAKIIFW